MESGYDKNRFKNVMAEKFECPICLCIVKNPYECEGCGDIYCNQCISDWLKKDK